MAVQQEIKSQLAKLLATEDLVVEHKSVPTAQFNVHTRVLTLPIWEKASHTVYDMLVGHEVSHALFTPDEDWTKKIKVPQQFVNVCEDVRVEKLMKRKYLGIAKTFYRGYNELNEQDFFEIEDEDITTFNLADRINLFYKVGSFVDVAFSDTEKEIVSLVGAAETFDEMLNVSEVLYEYCKKQQEQEEKISLECQPKQEGQLDFDFPSDSSQQEGEEGETESSPKPTPQMEESGGSQSDLPELDLPQPEVKTADALQDNIKDLVNMEGGDNVYLEVPTIKLDKIIVSNAAVHEEIDASWIEQQETWNKSEYRSSLGDIFEEIDSEYFQFKRGAQKEVSYLVKEFECRKAADNYARSTTSRTGVLDTAKLQSYRFNEDLFRKVTTIPDGKNHGLIFILDWSGSMGSVMQDTIKQLYNLIWFCRKVNIPFDVYAFTNEWIRYGEEVVHSRYEKKEYHFQIDDSFSLMNLFSSRVNAKTLEHQLINIWRIAAYVSRSFGCYYTVPQKVSLSGTPLNEALLCLHQLLPEFQKENKVQKVQCIVLTDGEAHQLPYHKEVTRHWMEPDQSYLGCRRVNPATSFLRDRKVGKTYKIGWNYSDFTSTLITNLKDRFPTVNFIGMRLLEKRDAMRFARMYYSEYTKEFEIIRRDWKKQRSFIIHNSGYDAYFALSSSNLADDAEFEVEDDATKAQIKRAFVKSLKTKKLNKKVLGEFISLVA